MKENRVRHWRQNPSGNPGRWLRERPTGLLHLEQKRLSSGTWATGMIAVEGIARRDGGDIDEAEPQPRAPGPAAGHLGGAPAGAHPAAGRVGAQRCRAQAGPGVVPPGP